MQTYPTTNQNTTGIPERRINFEVVTMEFDKFKNPKGKDMIKRMQDEIEFIDKMKKQKLFLYSRRMMTPPDSELYGMDEYGDIYYGLNFASADYLGLSQNEEAKEAAKKAADDFGVNSCGSPLAFGGHKYYYQLVEEIKEFWGVKYLMLYSAGWLAGFGVMKGFIRNYDIVLQDELCHNCLIEGIRSATKNIHRFKHLDNKACEQKLAQLRQQNPDTGIVVVTEGLFSMDADSPNHDELQRICKKYEAFLIIDEAHDFGCMGPNGRGCPEGVKDMSNVILMSGGSKCLSTNVGFVGCNDKSVIDYLKLHATSYMYTNAVNPIQCATALSQLRILKSQKGYIIRAKVIENYKYAKERLSKLSYETIGQPSPILIVYIGNELICRIVCRLMMDKGVHVNGIEYPVVGIGQARLRLNLMPKHDKKNIDIMVDCFDKCMKEAAQIFTVSLEEHQKKLQLKNQQAKL